MPLTLFGETVTGRACAVSFYGFVIEPFEGRFAPRREDGIEITPFGHGRACVAFTGSIQRFPEGDFGTINHRFLGDKRHRESLQSDLKRFCAKHRVTYRDPHWRVLCQGDSR